jgi:hypothetical protein
VRVILQGRHHDQCAAEASAFERRILDLYHPFSAPPTSRHSLANMEKPSIFRRVADKLAVESEPGLTSAQLMVRDPA